jgi:cysteine desulfurase
MHGGGQEDGLRPGTLNVPGIVGFGAAAAICRAEAAAEQPRLRALRDRLEAGLRAEPGVHVNGDPAHRLAHTTNLAFDGVDAAALMEALPDLALSSSAACTSARLQPSYVLGALGCEEERIRGSLRFSIGRFTTEAEIDLAVTALVKEVRRLRK